MTGVPVNPLAETGRGTSHPSPGVLTSVSRGIVVVLPVGPEMASRLATPLLLHCVKKVQRQNSKMKSEKQDRSKHQKVKNW